MKEVLFDSRPGGSSRTPLRFLSEKTLYGVKFTVFTHRKVHICPFYYHYYYFSNPDKETGVLFTTASFSLPSENRPRDLATSTPDSWLRVER